MALAMTSLASSHRPAAINGSATLTARSAPDVRDSPYFAAALEASPRHLGRLQMPAQPLKHVRLVDGCHHQQAVIVDDLGGSAGLRQPIEYIAAAIGARGLQQRQA